MKLTKAQIKAAQQWYSEMVDPANEVGPWTKFEVGEYHSAGIGAVTKASELKRLDALFLAAGGEAGLVEFLNK